MTVLSPPNGSIPRLCSAFSETPSFQSDRTDRSNASSEFPLLTILISISLRKPSAAAVISVVSGSSIRSWNTGTSMYMVQSATKLAGGLPLASRVIG